MPFKFKNKKLNNRRQHRITAAFFFPIVFHALYVLSYIDTRSFSRSVFIAVFFKDSIREIDNKGTIHKEETNEQKTSSAIHTPESKKKFFHSMGKTKRGIKTTIVVREEENKEIKTD